jgi:hypothetical protein
VLGITLGLAATASAQTCNSTVQSGESIQSAIDNANANDTVCVEDGTYEENVTVEKQDIVLEGPNNGTPGDGNRGPEATIEGQLAVSASGVTVDGMEVLGISGADDYTEGEALRVSNSSDSVEVRNNVVRGFDGSDLPQWEGADAIVAFGGDKDDTIQDVEITKNKVTNIQGRATKGGAAGISIQGNVDGATVQDNVVDTVGMEATDWAFGLVVTDSGNHDQVPTNVELTENEVTGVQSNPNSSNFGVGIENEADASEITATNNTFTDVERLAENKDANHELDVTENWWGDANGPDTEENPLETSAASMIDNEAIAYTPWLDAAPTDGGELTAPIENVDQTSYHLSFGDALDSAAQGDTLEASAGTYEESMTIPDTLDDITLSANGEATIVGDGFGAGTQPHAAIHVDSSNNAPLTGVTIEGFTIRNPDGAYGIYAGSGGGGADVTDLTVRDNTIEDVGVTAVDPDPLTNALAGLYLRANFDDLLVEDNTVQYVASYNSARAAGLSFSSFIENKPAFEDGNYAQDGTVRGNTIQRIVGTTDGYTRIKGISVSGEFDGLTVEDNIVKIIDSPARGLGITFTENPNGGDIDGDGEDERVGPRNFTIRDNDVDEVDAPTPSALWVGGYEDLGDDHAVTENTFDDTVERWLGSQDGFTPAQADNLKVNYNDLSGADPAFKNTGDTDWKVPYNYYDGCEAPVEGDVHADPVLTVGPADLVPDPIDDDVREYEVCAEIPANSTTALSTPAPLDQQLDEVMPDFEGNAYLFNEEVARVAEQYGERADISLDQAWQEADGTEELDAMEPVLVVNEGDAITAQLSVMAEDPALPTERAVTEGWNFLGPRSFADAEIGFSTATVDHTDLVHVYDEPTVSMPGETTAGAHHAFDSGTAPQVSPFTGFFVYADEDGSVPGAVTTGASSADFYEAVGLTSEAVAN